MGDILDDAQAISEQFQADILAQQLRRSASVARRVALTHCADCGEPIPEARRRAAPGCTRCIACQEAFERSPR